MKSTDCIIWDGAKWSQGRYGCDKLNGKSMGAHRAAWIRKFGNINKGIQVCHKCDNGLCVNTDHLFLGTATENMRDMVQKGRCNQKGSDNNNARKDHDEIKSKAKELKKDGLSTREINRLLGIKSNGHLYQLLKS